MLFFALAFLISKLLNKLKMESEKTSEISLHFSIIFTQIDQILNGKRATSQIIELNHRSRT